REKRDNCRMASRLIAGRAHTVPVVRDVGVAVDQAWNAGVPRKIDHLRAGWYGHVSASGALNAVVLNNDNRVGEGPSCPVDQLPELDGLCGRNGCRRGCEE